MLHFGNHVLTGTRHSRPTLSITWFNNEIQLQIAHCSSSVATRWMRASITDPFDLYRLQWLAIMCWRKWNSKFNHDFIYFAKGQKTTVRPLAWPENHLTILLHGKKCICVSLLLLLTEAHENVAKCQWCHHEFVVALIADYHKHIRTQFYWQHTNVYNDFICDSRRLITNLGLPVLPVGQHIIMTSNQPIMLKLEL